MDKTFTIKQYKEIRDLARSYGACRDTTDERDTGLTCLVYGFDSVVKAEEFAAYVPMELDGEYRTEHDGMFVVATTLV